MAGRPLKQFKTVKRIEELASEALRGINRALPSTYQKRAESDPRSLAKDPLGKQWIDTQSALTEAVIETFLLREMLGERAGLPPEPLPESFMDMLDASDEPRADESVQVPITADGLNPAD
jgi:hypothetical protein